MQPLYKISEAYLAVLDALDNEGDEFPEEALRDTLEGLEGEFELKARNVAMHILNLEHLCTAIREVERANQARRHRHEATIGRLERYLMDEMTKVGKRKIETPEVALSIRSFPGKVEIRNEEEIPFEFKVEEIVTKLDKAAMLKRYREGGFVPGTEFVKGEALKIS